MDSIKKKMQSLATETERAQVFKSKKREEKQTKNRNKNLFATG